MQAEGIIEIKKRKAEELAGEKGYLTRKEFASLLEIYPSRVSGILKSPGFGKFIRRGTGGGRGPVWIPLETVMRYLEKVLVIE